MVEKVAVALGVGGGHGESVGKDKTFGVAEKRLSNLLLRFVGIRESEIIREENNASFCKTHLAFQALFEGI